MTRLGIITGLVRETRCLDDKAWRQPPVVRCDGMGPARAARAAEGLLADGCTALLSFGIAGGLAPDLTPGTVIVPHQVIGADGRRQDTDAAWGEALRRRLPAEGLTVSTGPLAGSDTVIRTPDAKRRMHETSGAVAVDMESHAVARVAGQAGIRFMVLRLVSDPAGTSIPKAAMRGVGADGRDRPWAVAAALLGRPGDLPALLRLRRQSSAAMACLRRVAVGVGPGFGLD